MLQHSMIARQQMTLQLSLLRQNHLTRSVFSRGTTGQYYVEGSEDWDFPGLPAKCVTYKSGSLAVQDMLNGNIQYVIIDAAPAAAITEAINAVQ